MNRQDRERLAEARFTSRATGKLEALGEGIVFAALMALVVALCAA